MKKPKLADLTGRNPVGFGKQPLGSRSLISAQDQKRIRQLVSERDEALRLLDEAQCLLRDANTMLIALEPVISRGLKDQDAKKWGNEKSQTWHRLLKVGCRAMAVEFWKTDSERKTDDRHTQEEFSRITYDKLNKMFEASQTKRKIVSRKTIQEWCKDLAPPYARKAGRPKRTGHNR